MNGDRNAGASIALGYVPPFIIGAFIFIASVANAPVTASPAGIPAIFLDLVYPTVFGAIGGVLAEHRAERESKTLDRGTEDDVNP